MSRPKLTVELDFDLYASAELIKLRKEVSDLKDSQMRLVDALKACKERNGEPTN